MTPTSLGIFYGLLAGVLWGILFIIPNLVPEASALFITLFRYVTYGAISTVHLWMQHHRLRSYWRLDHISTVIIFALIGNSIYYAMLVVGLRLVGVPTGSMIVGLVPLTLILFGANGRFTRGMIGSCALILAGLSLLNYELFAVGQSSSAPLSLKVVGLVLVILCLFMWTYYGITNASYLKKHPDINISIWTSLIGVMSFITALVMLYFTSIFEVSPIETFLSYSSDTKFRLVFWGFVSGSMATWLAYSLWNKASQLVPTSLLGQLIVFETITAILYDHLIAQRWPNIYIIGALALTISGVFVGIRSAVRGPKSP